MRESTWTQSVHRHLKGRCYIWKIADRFQAGIPDAYYRGANADLFVEYKYLPKLPPLIRADLSALQKRWLLTRYRQGQQVAVIVGTPKGGVIYPGIAWTRPIRRDDLHNYAMKQKQIAGWILHTIGDTTTWPP